MPRGQTKEVLKPFQPSSWKGKTKTVRVPICIADQVRAIALWADQQTDPEAAMQQLLSYIQTTK